MIAQKIYGADDIVANNRVQAKFAELEKNGHGRLPVCLAHNPGRIIGLVSRRALMQRYHTALQGNG